MSSEASKATADEIRLERHLRFIYFVPALLVLWALGGMAPFLVGLVNGFLERHNLIFFHVDWVRLGQFGDTFGAANALFGGGGLIIAAAALFAQIVELRKLIAESKQHTREFQEQSRFQRATMAGQVLLPVFEETRRNGSALRIVAANWRAIAREVLGYDPNVLINKLKRDPVDADTYQELERVSESVRSEFEKLRLKEKMQEQWQNKQEQERYEELDGARRLLSLTAQKVYQISNADLAIDPKVLRLAAFPDFVATYKFCAYPLDLAIERERRPAAAVYPPGYHLIGIYQDAELRDAMY